jgi:hypothetical protein
MTIITAAQLMGLCPGDGVMENKDLETIRTVVRWVMTIGTVGIHGLAFLMFICSPEIGMEVSFSTLMIALIAWFDHFSRKSHNKSLRDSYAQGNGRTSKEIYKAFMIVTLLIITIVAVVQITICEFVLPYPFGDYIECALYALCAIGAWARYFLEKRETKSTMDQ